MQAVRFRSGQSGFLLNAFPACCTIDANLVHRFPS
jgi:hypothetical protein